MSNRNNPREKSQNVIFLIEKLKKFYGVKTDIQLARELGINQSTLSNWKRRNVLPCDVIITKCENVSLDWLFRDEDVPDGKWKSTTEVAKENAPFFQRYGLTANPLEVIERLEREVETLEQENKDLRIRLRQAEKMFAQTIEILKPTS